MKRRLECSLLLGSQQFVEFHVEGSVELSDLPSTEFGVQFGLGRSDDDDHQDGSNVADWFGAFSTYTWLRRAAEDTHTALKNPADDVLFLFRAFEWLQKGLKVRWSELGTHIDVPQADLARLKKQANHQRAAARHAFESGTKTHLDLHSWGEGALHAIARARAAVDPEYKQ